MQWFFFIFWTRKNIKQNNMSSQLEFQEREGNVLMKWFVHEKHNERKIFIFFNWRNGVKYFYYVCTSLLPCAKNEKRKVKVSCCWLLVVCVQCTCSGVCVALCNNHNLVLSLLWNTIKDDNDEDDGTRPRKKFCQKNLYHLYISSVVMLF